ncbi:MAG: hypothetical protein J6Q51_03285 [Clostridia bacterium]|nr:hypothetical protein [Clostridia bacterium]
MKYTTQITLYNSYFDKNDRLTTKSILSIFQDVASIHAEDIGVGYMTMLNKNMLWVLSRIKFDVIKMPEPNQTVIVETWPQPKGKIDFDRDMKILDKNGDVLIIATSKWCIIDTQTRTLQRTENVNYLGSCCLEKNYEEKFGKIILPTQQPIKQQTHTVRFCDLDHNLHMNNTSYANLILNVLQDKLFFHFEINFISECLLGDQIDVYLTTNFDGDYVVGKVKDKTVFVAYLK